MDSKELKKALTQLGQVVAESGGKQPTIAAIYDAPQRVKEEARDLYKQKEEHRNKLLKLLSRLSASSFAFLAIIILTQMIIRIFKPSYTGVSDTVINIITGGVFGEVIAVVAVIVKQVWKD